MRHPEHAWRASARRAGTISLTAIASASMLFCGSPLALAASLAQNESAPISTAAAAETANTSNSSESTSTETEPWSNSIDSMLSSGSYADGEVVAIVAPAAEGTAVNAVSVDNDAQVEPLTESLLDTADTEELSKTNGDVYEDAFDTALPDAALEGAQLMAAAENDGEAEAVQASDVDVCTLLVKQNGMSTEQILRELANDDRVLWAEPNYSGKISDGSMSTQTSGSAAQALATKLDSNSTASNTTSDGKNGGTDTDATDSVSGVTPAGKTTVAATDELADATDYQWGYNSNSTAFGALHKSEFTVKLENWNNAQMQNSKGIVAVVDTGIDHDNPDLSDVMADMSPYVSKIGGDKWGYNATGDDGGSEDVAGHGSHCAGIVASDWNAFGTSGAANGAELLSVRAANEQGFFFNSSTIRGFKYIENAVDAGADIRVASNSWGGEGSSHAVWLAAEALGRKGTMVVFAAGNETLDLDVNTYTGQSLGTSDYTVVVDSAMMTGAQSAFSNYGKTATDVFAPGSYILSTAISSGEHCTSAFLPELLKNSSDNYFYEDFSGNSSKVEAWVGISQLDKDAVAKKKIGEVDTSKLGFDSAAGVLKVSTAALEQAAENTDGGSLMVSLKVPVDASTVSSITNASVAVSLDGGEPGDALGFSALCLETVDANGNAIRTGGRAGLANLEAGWNKMGTTVSESIEEKGTQLAVHTDENGNSYIWMHVLVSTMLLGDADGVLFDCVGLGSKLVPYVYYSGTSMACPAVAGLAAVASTQMNGYDSMDKSARAAELAKLIKSSVNTFNNQFSGLCTSNGMIDASKFASKSARSPQISSAKLADDEATLTICGSEFGSKAGSVTFGGKSATVKSWSDNKIVIECPADLVSGYLELVLTRADGKSCTHAETFVFTKNVSKDEVPVFEETIETPSEFDDYCYYNELAALDNSIYVFAGELEQTDIDPDYPQSASCYFKDVWRYSIADKSWKRAADLPCHLANVSRTLWNGKLLVMGAAASKDYGGFANKKLFSYDPATDTWTDLSDKVAGDDVPYQASIVNVGGKLLIVGGNIVTGLPASAAEADEKGVYVDATAYNQAAAKETQKSDTVMMTLSKNNVRSLDLKTGKVKVIGSVSPRCNVGFDNAKSDVQTALCGSKLYVFGGAYSDPMTTETVTDQGPLECVTLNTDGTTTTEKLGAYDAPQSKDTIGALPAALDNYKLRSSLTGAKNGPVLSGVLATTGFDELGMVTSKLVQDDTYQLTSGSSAFASIGKRVNYTPTIYASALAYRGKLYVLGHDFNGSFETVMRATDIETDELPGDVTSKKSDENGKTDENTEKKDADKTSSVVSRVLPKTGDMAVAAAIICLAVGGAALAITRKVRA